MKMPCFAKNDQMLRLVSIAVFTFWLCLPPKNFANRSVKYPEIIENKTGTFQFGDILIDKNKRAFSFPALCNQTSGLVEYALVHENGKVHESLFRTSLSPRLIHACLLLLKESPQVDFFENVQTAGSDYSKFRTVEISVVWEANGTTSQTAINTMVMNQTDDRLLDGNTFVFTGSKVIEGEYLAETDGSIVAVYHDNRAVVNCMDKESDSDDVWVAKQANMPPKEFPVWIHFQLLSKD